MRSSLPALPWNRLEVPLGAALDVLSRGVLACASIEEVHEAATPAPAIFVNWHRHLPLLVVHHGHRGRWMLMSAAPRMAPIARWATRSGLRLVRGASGERGQEAVGALAERLREGESIVLAVDGPHGPVFRARPGCIELARRTGAAIVPVGYEVSPDRTVRSRWDCMSMVLPRSRVTLRYGAPIRVTGEPDELQLQRVSDALDALDPQVPRLRAALGAR
jgi:lysophospholipid acyltransferase (LPLAT)-like uncharacterized protein